MESEGGKGDEVSLCQKKKLSSGEFYHRRCKKGRIPLQPPPQLSLHTYNRHPRNHRFRATGKGSGQIAANFGQTSINSGNYTINPGESNDTGQAIGPNFTKFRLLSTATPSSPVPYFLSKLTIIAFSNQTIVAIWNFK